MRDRDDSRDRGGRSSGRGDRGRDRDDDRGSSRGGGRGYSYKPRSASDTQKRADSKGGADFDSIFKSDVKAFKMNDGDNEIRILPPTFPDPTHYGLDIFVHYGVGPDNQAYLCLNEMKGEACPICEERKQALKDDDEDYAKKLRPSKRVLVYLVDRENEKEGVQAWAMPWTFDRDLCAILVDKKSGELLPIDDPDRGYDIEFTRKGKAPKIEYIGIRAARRDSPLGDDDWLQYAVDHPLTDILQFYSYDHIAAVFDGASSGGQSNKDKDDDLDSKQDRGLRASEERGRREASRDRNDDDDNLTWESLHGMTYDELCAVVDREELKINPEDSKDDEDLADWICEELKIEKTASRRERNRTREEPKEEDTGRGRLSAMRRDRDR